MSQSDFVTRGQALVTSGQYQEAVKVCRLGLLGRPTTVEGRIVLGQALLALKRFDEVLAEMRVALELDHGSMPAQLLKAEALLKKGDVPAAIEVLDRVRPLTPADEARLATIRSDAQRVVGRPAVSASHPAVGFVGGTGEPTNESTKHYPNHSADEEDTHPKEDGDENTGGGFTRPTSLANPASMKKRSNRQQAMGAQRDDIPPAAVLAIGDRSGTVEVDPEADGVEVEGDDDFGAVAAPPRAHGTPASRSTHQNARGSVKPATGRVPKAKATPASAARGRPRGEVSSVELDNDDLVEVEDTPLPAEPPTRRAGGTAVRNAVKLPSGPIDQPFASPAATRKTEQAPAQVPPLAHMIAQQPHMMQVNPVPHGQGFPAQPMPLGMPPAQHHPPMPLGMPPPANPNAVRPTMALNAAQQQSAAAVDALFGAEQAQPGAQAWARSTVVAGSPAQAGPQGMHGHRVQRAAADEPTRQADAIDPRIAYEQSSPAAAAFADQPSSVASGKPLKTGMRRARSRLQVLMWILVGAAVIGGGVFAGFQIRAMRLKKQIAAARTQAVDLAKADTWQGWSGARDRLAGIARASSTVDNRAALARARGVLAYEFGDGLAEAKAALDKLGPVDGIDAAIAAGYLALAQSDPKAAKAAADKAAALAPNDAAVLYVAGQAAVLNGDYKIGIASLRSSHEREPRPLYAVGLARATAQTGAWDDALAAVDRALGAMPDHPAALIERALILVASGKIAAGNTITAEVRTQLLKLIAEGAKPVAEQARGVSPAQVALANLALAQIDFALRDVKSALAAVTAGADVLADVQRFGEEAIDTLYAFNELQKAKAAAGVALAMWPGSRRARASQALVMIALGKPTEALDILTRNPDAVVLPRGLAVRGQARLVTGDLDGARSDFDAALKKLPLLELALIGRAWVDLADGDVDAASKRIEPRFNPNSSSVAMITVHAAIQRMSADPAAREKAKALLEKVVAGPPSVDVPRALLELARLYRDTGDFKSARNTFAEAMRNGNTEAKLDAALLSIEASDPSGGRATLDSLIKDSGATASANLLLEGARARMLDGDHPGATALLDQAEKTTGVESWHLDRERGRLMLRKGDLAGAATALSRALETSGSDPETFLIAADIVAADAKANAALAQRIKASVATRLKDLPEAKIVKGKLALAAENDAEAVPAYDEAIKLLEKATPRRQAQAYFGRAVILYNKGDDPSAKAQLDLVIPADPSIYAAYLFAADLSKGKTAEALGLAQKAVRYNPDFVAGWYTVGTLAAKLKKTKELQEAIARLTVLAPAGDELKELQALR